MKKTPVGGKPKHTQISGYNVENSFTDKDNRI